MMLDLYEGILEIFAENAQPRGRGVALEYGEFMGNFTVSTRPYIHSRERNAPKRERWVPPVVRKAPPVVILPSLRGKSRTYAPTYRGCGACGARAMPHRCAATGVLVP
jgi:hypothetical protein